MRGTAGFGKKVHYRLSMKGKNTLWRPPSPSDPSTEGNSCRPALVQPRSCVDL